MEDTGKERLKLTEIYTLVGGTNTLERIVDVFYNKIDKDDILRDMFPQDLEEARKRQLLYFEQIFGGPANYTRVRGRPEMRKRHLPFAIGVPERDRWVKLMMESWDEVGITEEHKVYSTIQFFFDTFATKMINKWPEAKQRLFKEISTIGQPDV